MSEENNPKLFPTPKKGVWAIHKSKTKGKYYYFNISTGESYWERPKELKDADLSLLHFPEGNFIPENVNTGSAWDKKKQPIKSNKADKSPIKNRKTVKKYAKITADFLKDTEENTVEQCKTCKSKHGSAAREKIKDRLLKGAKHVESSANKQKLLFKKINLVQAEPELPAYTDSDEDEEPVSAKKIKANDGDKICQSKISNFKIPKKIMDSGQSLTETSDIDNREQISGTQRDVAIEQSELIDEYEEMEWSPNPTNNDIDRVETEVESNCTEWSSLENEITPMEIDIANPKDTCLVIDTNILIHDMELVRSITTSDLADGSKIIVVIPWQVLRELDGLKKNEKVRQKCTTAIRFLHQCFSDKSSNVIAQNALSEKLGKDLIEIDVPDDNILACCLQVISLDRRTVLLTNDINLCNKAMAHNIEAYTREEFLKESNSLGLSVKNKGGIRSIKTGFRPHIFGYPPSPPADNLPYSVVKNLLARKHRKCRSENDEESQILVIPLSDDRNKTKGTVDNKPKPSRPASTETISNLIPNSLNSESNYEATCNHINIPLQVPVEKPPLPGSVLKNMLPRKSMPTTQKNEQKPTKRSHARSSSGPSIKTTPLQKRLSVSNSVPSPALKSPSCSENQSQVRPSFQAQETSVEMTVAKQFDLFKFVKLSPSDYSSPSWDKFKKFKFAVAEFLFSVLKTGMCRMSRGDWTWRIILSPPWTVEQLCICLRTHWLTLTDHFPSQQILEYLQCLQECINDIDNENMTLENLNMAINMCFLITPPLRNYFNQLVEIFESKLNSLLPKLGVNEEVSHQYWSCFTEDVDPTRCFDLLSKILNKTFKFLVWFQKVFDNCTTFYGDIDFDSPYIFQLYQFEAALKQKLRPITLIIAGLKAILNHGSNVPQDPIDKLTLCLLEETEYPDPFFSKDDVITIALESDYRLCIKEYWIKYEDIRRKLLATLNELVLPII